MFAGYNAVTDTSEEAGLNLKLESNSYARDNEKLKWQKLTLQIPMHPNVYRSWTGSTSKVIYDEVRSYFDFYQF